MNTSILTNNYNIILAVAVAALLSVLNIENSSYVLLAGILVGMPHGATDIMTKEKFNSNVIWFYAVILSLLALCWYLSPVLALSLFLFSAVIHFGTEDALADAGSLLFYHESLVRGTLVIFAAIYFYTEDVIALFEMITQKDLAPHFDTSVITYAKYAWVLFTFTLFAHCALKCKELAQIVKIFLEIGVLVTIFRYLPPVEAFVIYFVFMHSLRAMQKLKETFLKHWKLMLVLTLFTVIFGILFYQVEVYKLTDTNSVRVGFITLSLFSVPHSLIRTLSITTTNPRND